MSMNEEESNFVDWSTHGENSYYYSFSSNTYIVVGSANDIHVNTDEQFEEGYEVVRVGVPRTFT